MTSGYTSRSSGQVAHDREDLRISRKARRAHPLELGAQCLVRGIGMGDCGGGPLVLDPLLVTRCLVDTLVVGCVDILELAKGRFGFGG